MDNTARDQLKFLETEIGRKLFMDYCQRLNSEQKTHFVECSVEQRQFLFFHHLHQLTLKFPFQEFLDATPIPVPAIVQEK